MLEKRSHYNIVSNAQTHTIRTVYLNRTASNEPPPPWWWWWAISVYHNFLCISLMPSTDVYHNNTQIRIVIIITSTRTCCAGTYVYECVVRTARARVTIRTRRWRVRYTAAPVEFTKTIRKTSYGIEFDFIASTTRSKYTCILKKKKRYYRAPRVWLQTASHVWFSYTVTDAFRTLRLPTSVRLRARLRPRRLRSPDA